MSRPQPQRLADYRHTLEIPTRWGDNDAYGHVNNAVYYAYFDTVVNTFLIREGVLDIEKGPVIGLVVETGCQFFAPLVYPETVTAALRVATLGRSSVRYEVALFGEAQDRAAAQGHFVHVYVDRETRRPTEVSARLREVLESIRSGGAPA